MSRITGRFLGKFGKSFLSIVNEINVCNFVYGGDMYNNIYISTNINRIPPKIAFETPKKSFNKIIPLFQNEPTCGFLELDSKKPQNQRFTYPAKNYIFLKEAVREWFEEYSKFFVIENSESSPFPKSFKIEIEHFDENGISQKINYGSLEFGETKYFVINVTTIKIII